MTDKIMLAERWNKSIDPTGWLASEKLDGFHAYWTGKELRLRKKDGIGDIVECPEYFTKNLPKESLDGELWAGRGNLHLVAAAVKGSRKYDWRRIVFAIFDSPDYNGGFEERLAHAKNELANAACKTAIVVPHMSCPGNKWLLERLDKIVEAGGEGLMIRKPGSKYVRNRTNVMLKVKKMFDAEAVIIEHVEGTRPGLCGALKVKTKDGKIFKVGSGITELIAHNPPPIGTSITYSWDTITKDGIPRPATFVRVRE